MYKEILFYYKNQRQNLLWQFTLGRTLKQTESIFYESFDHNLRCRKDSHELGIALYLDWFGISCRPYKIYNHLLPESVTPQPPKSAFVSDVPQLSINPSFQK